MNCHEGDIRALQPGKTEADFRPGTPLNNTVAILKAPIDPRSTESPLLEHYYSMTLSKCYRGSGGKFGCQTCHDPARATVSRRKPRNIFAASVCNATPRRAALSICRSVWPSSRRTPAPPATCSDSRRSRSRTRLSPTTAFVARRASPIPKAPSRSRCPAPASFTSMQFRERTAAFRRWRCCRPTARNSFGRIWNTRTTISLSWIGWRRRTTKIRSCSRPSPRKRRAMET